MSNPKSYHIFKVNQNLHMKYESNQNLHMNPTKPYTWIQPNPTHEVWIQPKPTHEVWIQPNPTHEEWIQPTLHKFTRLFTIQLDVMSIRIHSFIYVQSINIHSKVSIELNIYTNIDLKYFTLRHKMQHINKAWHMTNYVQNDIIQGIK